MGTPLTLEDLLGSDPEPANANDPLANYVEVTPRALAILNLTDCLEQLRRSKAEPIRLAQAAKSAHLALQCALIDALAGSAKIGAYNDKLRAAFLAYFEESRNGDAEPPKDDRVMRFEDLLAKAISHPMEWSGKTLQVSEDDKQLLSKLTFIRHRIEHPRPQHHFFKPAFIALTLPVAAKLTVDLLDVCYHHFAEGERAAIKVAHEEIEMLCGQLHNLGRSE